MIDPTASTIVASTVVQLARLVVAAYGIGAARVVIIHWLDTKRDPTSEPLFPLVGRTAEERQIDAARRNGNNHE